MAQPIFNEFAIGSGATVLLSADQTNEETGRNQDINEWTIYCYDGCTVAITPIVKGHNGTSYSDLPVTTITNDVVVLKLPRIYDFSLTETSTSAGRVQVVGNY